jgi:hypothetical protein
LQYPTPIFLGVPFRVGPVGEGVDAVSGGGRGDDCAADEMS